MQPRTIEVTLDDLGLKKVHGVRDVWRQKNLASHSEKLSLNVARHGVEMLRVR